MSTFDGRLRLHRQEAWKRGRGNRVVLDTAVLVGEHRELRLVALDDALQRLAVFDSRKSQIVELRVFAGLTLEEISHAMNVAVITVRRDWKLALAWLRRELENTA